MAQLTREEVINVETEPHISAARVAARNMAMALGFDNICTAQIETAVSELATNLIKYRAVKGRIILRRVEEKSRIGIEILSEDEGPGIKDIDLAVGGGSSTSGSLGIGLSGVKRLMEEFYAESQLGKGTRVRARKWVVHESSRMDFSVFSRPKPGEDVCGDGYFIKRFNSSVLFSVVDALGHGKEAHLVTLRVLEILESNYSEPLDKIIEKCHKALHNSRGAAMALCKIDISAQKMEHLSVGDVETRIYGTPKPARPICFNGTLGMVTEHYRVFDYPYSQGAIIVMFSDGISGKFDLEPKDLVKTPQEIASRIFTEYARSTDDATILVGR